MHITIKINIFDKHLISMKIVKLKKNLRMICLENSWLLCLIKTFDAEFFLLIEYLCFVRMSSVKRIVVCFIYIPKMILIDVTTLLCVFCDGKNGISKSPTPILVYFCVEYSLSLRELTWQLNDIDYPYQMYWSNVEDHLLVGSYIKENNQLTYDIFSVNIVYFPRMAIRS